VRPVVLNYIMRLFETAWCRDNEVGETELLEAWVRAHVAAGTLPGELQAILAKRRPYRLRKFIKETRFHEDDAADAAIGDLLDRGDLADWRPLAAAVARDPWGPLAVRTLRRVEAYRCTARPGGGALGSTCVELRGRRTGTNVLGV